MGRVIPPEPNTEPNLWGPNAPLENNPHASPAEDPDVEWCAERAADAMRWLADNYPESGGSPELHPHQDAAHQAAVAGDKDAYLDALRAYMRTGRAVALRRRSRREAA